MSTTAQQIFYDARALIDELTDEGVLIPAADVADMQSKSILFIDMAQKELYSLGKLFKTHEFTRKAYENLIGSGFDVAEYAGTAQYYPENGAVAKAYYFEVDGEAMVAVQELQAGVWSDLITITVPNTVTSMIAYKGVITPSAAGNLVRLKFAGTYQYIHQNRALFAAPFSAARVPAYRPWVKYTMPTDFRACDSIIEEYPPMVYGQEPSVKWEGYKDLYVNYYYEGTVRIVYKPVPITITAITDTLEIDDITSKLIGYYVAARLAVFENPSLVNYFEQKFNELKLSVFVNTPQTEQTIIDVYGGGWS